MSLQYKFFIFLLFIALFPLTIAGLFSFQQARQELIKGTTEKLVAVADVQKKRVNESLDRYLENVKFITSRTELRVSLGEYEQTGSPESLNKVQSVIVDAKASVPTIDAISIRDRSGMIIASTDSRLIGKPDELDEYARGVQTPELHEIFKNEVNLLRVRLFGALFLENQKIGVVEMAMSADPLVAVIADYAGLGNTGEVLLAKKNQNGDGLYITPLRFDAGAALTRAVPKEQMNMGIIHALLGEEKTFIESDFVDYRDEPIFAVTRFIDSLGWGLVVKIDRDEAFIPIKDLLGVYVSIFFLTILFVSFVALFLSRLITRPIMELTRAAVKIATLDFSTTTTTTTERRNDELGKLAAAFNTMVGKLKGFYATLEGRVAERTAELFEKTEEAEKSKMAVLNILEDLKIEEQKLAEAKAKDEAILAGIGDGVFVIDTSGAIILFNNVAEVISGWPAREALGKNYRNILKFALEDKTDVMTNEFIEHALQGKKAPMAHHAVIIQKDGTQVPVADSAAPIFDSVGKVQAVVVVFRNVTKEREVDKAKTEFVSLASHQLRTPLSTVSWYAEMLLAGDAGKLNKEQEKYLNEVYTGNKRMVALVNALLNVSRLELGTFVVEPEPTNIVTLAQSVIDEQKPQMDEKKLHCQSTFGKNIPVIHADPKLLRMVFQNLVSNAVKYTPEDGKIGLSLSVDNEKKNILLQVSDTGYGIPKNQQDKIFTKLFRADNVREKDTEGTGLGLYIIKSIIEHSGGKVWFESVENKGTTFYASLPLEGMKKKEGTKNIA